MNFLETSFTSEMFLQLLTRDKIKISDNVRQWKYGQELDWDGSWI
jgi:hypothetical protein